jgi:crotonobetainyl-CoA:carnitine CoA-transferase CaiB-like acyl-CoA transferase
MVYLYAFDVRKATETGMTDENALFAGLKVLDVGSWIAGPVAATMLADYGADVIKIEVPGRGDPYRYLAQFPTSPRAEGNYTWMMDARNKRSLTLNLKADAGKAILERLVADCDVYITNQPLPMRRALGLTYHDLKPLNPRMIYASLTAYGEDGPDRDREGFDLVAYWSRTGLMDAVRARGAEPAQALPGMGDHPTAVALYAAIVTALLKRERTGEGSMVHTSLIANGLWSASCIAQAVFAGGDLSGWRANPVTVGRTLYETADGRWLQLTMVRTEDELARFLDVLGLREILADERFGTPQARLENGAELVGRIKPVIRMQSAAEWMRAFAAAGTPAALIGSFEDLPEDPQLEINRVVARPSDRRHGEHPLIMHPVNVDGLARAPITRPPEIGEHSAAILEGLGYDDATIAKLQADGVI